MTEEKVVQVYFDHFGDSGEQYYRTIPNNQLLVKLNPEGWHTAIDDSTWEEPVGPITTRVKIQIIGRKDLGRHGRLTP